MSWFNPFEGGGTGGGGSSTAYATSLVLSLNTETYELTATLKNKDGDTLGTPQVIDLPLETMVVSGRYDENTKMVILVLSNGQEISFSVADLISGLQSEITVNNKLNIELIDCEGSHYKIVWVGTSAEYTAAASSIPENIPVIKTDDDDMDQTPTENSENLVSSGGVYSFVVQGLAGKANSSDLGTAASKDVPASGNASTTQVVMGNDTRLTDSRPASDVSEWAKALTKPSYSYSEINNTPTVDAAPASGSNNLVSSGGVYTALGNKVDKVQGKGLSTEDYTTAEKTKLGGIEAEANKTVVDSALSDSSTNPVQNKVVKENLDDKYPKAWDVELTQAQYDALPASKYVDGKNYYITDGNTDEPIIYGFHVDPDESDPSDAVTYLMDAVGMEPAKMGTTAFNYGSWKNAFFMPKPCMLKYDGTVDYYLDPNDFSKKVDGTASDISNYAYNGNAMMEFPKIWFKFVAGVAEGEGYFYVSNQQVDSSYHCWANYDADGNETDHFYMSIYNGVIYDGKMRSLSGKKLSPWSTTTYSSSATYAVDSVVNYDDKMWKCITAVETAEAFDSEKWEQFGFNGNTTGQQEVDAAVANDTTAKSEWYIDTWCDRVLITAFLYLMGKSLDLQSTYGRGIDSGSQTAAENYTTGAANDKGMFYGSTTSGNTVVKVFGIENFWACKWRRTAGCIGLNNGKVAYKMTSSTADGSTATAYNTDGTGYLIDNIVRPSNGYVSKMGFGNWGLIPRSITGGNSNIYYCDYFYTNNSATTFALVGGLSSGGLGCGFYVFLSATFTSRYWYIAAALSCKPLA